MDPLLIFALVWISHILAASALVYKLYKPQTQDATLDKVIKGCDTLFAQVATAMQAMEERLNAFEKRTLVQVKDLAQGLNDLAQGNIGVQSGDDVEVEYAEVAEPSSADKSSVENRDISAPRANLRAEAPPANVQQKSRSSSVETAEAMLAQMRARRPTDGSAEVRP